MVTLIPASGYRDYDSGQLNDVGSYGNYWSAAPYNPGDSDAGQLYFNSNGNVNPLNNDYRANGYSVRCARVFTSCSKEIQSIYTDLQGLCCHKHGFIRFISVENLLFEKRGSLLAEQDRSSDEVIDLRKSVL